MDTALHAGDPDRERLGRVLLAGLATMAGFVGFALVTTQVHAVRAQSPWQDDPYDGFVSLTMFCVPVVMALVLLRVLLCQRDRPLPVVRARGLLRAAGFGLVLVLATVAVDVVAWALGVRRGDWGPDTSLMLGAAVLLVLASVAGLVAGRRIGRVLPESGRDDWSADLVPLGDLLARRLRWHAVARFARAADRRLLSGPHGVRAHPVAWSVAAAEVGAAVLVSGLVVRERTPLWLIGPLGALVAGAGFLWVVYAANRWLGLARVEPGRPDLRALGLGAAVGLDLAFAFRDPLWALLGLGSSVPGLGLVYLVMLVGAVLGAGLTWLVRRLTPRRWPVAARP